MHCLVMELGQAACTMAAGMTIWTRVPRQMAIDAKTIESINPIGHRVKELKAFRVAR